MPSQEFDYRDRAEKPTTGFLGIDKDLDVAYDDDVLNLSVGVSSPEILKKVTPLVLEATQHCLKIAETDQAKSLFQYGKPEGPLKTRKLFAEYLTSAYGDKVYYEDLMLTTGASAGVHNLLSSVLDHDGYIFIDELIFMLTYGIINQFSGLKVVPVKLNDDGVDLKDLEQKILKTDYASKNKSKLFWGVYLTVPNYHNPTGITFSDQVCKGLIKIARKYDLGIICDDVYNLLHYDDKIPKRLYSYDSMDDVDYKGHVISNASLSKPISPGMRIGWYEVPPRVKSVLCSKGMLVSSGGFCNYTMTLLASMFETGIAQEHIKFVKATLGERMHVTVNVLQKNLPSSCSFINPGGGYFVWIRLPKGKSAKDLLRIAKNKYKVFYLCGEIFSHLTERDFSNCLRITIGYYSKDVLEDGVSKLCQAIQEFLSE
ncbi:hypothetical protein ACFFRR_010852 [Megaselia abdita]